MSTQAGPTLPAAAAGFSLFELVVFIIAVAIIYATAANRFSEFPGQAERANFLAVTTEIQTAINLEMMLGVKSGRISELATLEGANPMDLLLEPPSNYLGVFDVVDLERFPRRVWYFDRSRSELVYRVNDVNGVYLVQDGREIATEQIRFRMALRFSDVDRATGLPVALLEAEGDTVPEENRRRRFDGVLMEPIIPYVWGEGEAETMLAQAQGGLVDIGGSQ